MQLLIFCMIGYILIGGAGMAIGSRKVEKKVAAQRWLKYSTYVIIISLVVLSIYYRWFFPVAIIVAIAGWIEITVILWKQKGRKWEYVFVLVYLMVAFSFMEFAAVASPVIQFYIYFQVFTFDAFCQVTGQIWGRRKITPKISPGKTWEGLIGGTLFCMLSGTIGAAGLNILSPFTGLLAGLLTAAAAFSGDLLASALKRRLGVKDYSSVLPGQGGVLDRFDSFLFAGALYFIINN
jgi:phosphatidate cytidylyltransferase